MASYTQVGYGSQGSDVKTLQQMLNSKGYSLDVDGIFGSKTQAAVKDYQQKNNLAVDGIVGTNTWGALTKTASTPQKTITNTQSTAQTATKTTPTYQNKTYQESDAVKQAQAMLQQQMAQKPGAYQSQWQAQLDEAMNKILNREKFSYDLNGDALYQQYKDQYMMQGQQAMMDTMGQAQAMTGGYGNSYAQSVGQQTYQGYLQQLNDKVPELYQLALDAYNREGDEMYQQYAMMADREGQDYDRYRDSVADWNTDYDRAYQQYRDEQNFDYGKYADDRDFSYGQYIDDRNYQYQVDRDAVADKQWQDSFDYQKDRDAIEDQQWQDSFDYQKDRDAVSDSQWNQSFQYQQDRDKVSDEQWQKEFDEAVRQYNQKNGISTSTGGNGGSGDTTGGGDTPTGNPTPSTDPDESPEGLGPYNNGGLSTEEIKEIQRTLGVTVDGKWGSDSQKAAKAMWGVTSATDAQAKNNSMKQNTGSGSNFTGSTYSEAAAYLKSNGIPTAGLMTQSEWQRHKNNNNSTGGEHEASNYQEYLAAYIYGKTAK